MRDRGTTRIDSVCLVVGEEGKERCKRDVDGAGNQGSEAGACKGFGEPRGSGPGLASRVVRHVERDSGRFVVWHVEVEPTVPRFSPNYKTNAVHSVIIQLVDVPPPPSSPLSLPSSKRKPPAFHGSVLSLSAAPTCRSVWLRLQRRTDRLSLCASDSLSLSTCYS